MWKKYLGAIGGVFILVALGQGLRAADPVVTAIRVPDMHCMGCARKMADKVSKVPGVGAVQADVPKAILLVTPKPQQLLSPRALWEAVELAGYKPNHLEGPSGTFTEKPQS